MKSQRSGTIAVTSTLPDRRGVPGWCAYGSSKAALSWLMESLRAEAQQEYNIKIITIKPGSVETPMIKDYRRHGAISPVKAAKLIIEGIRKGKKIIQFPLGQVLATRVQDLFPVFAYDDMDRPRLYAPDFYIPKLGLYIEVYGSKEFDYEYRKMVYEKNGIPVVFLHFHKRPRKWKPFLAERVKEIEQQRKTESEKLSGRAS